MRAGREPAPVDYSPKPVVPEATALPGVEPTPPAPEPLRLSGRVSMPARPIALAEGASQTFAIDVQGTVRDRCVIPGSWTTRQGAVRQGEGPSWSYAQLRRASRKSRSSSATETRSRSDPMAGQGSGHQPAAAPRGGDADHPNLDREIGRNDRTRPRILIAMMPSPMCGAWTRRGGRGALRAGESARARMSIS